MLRFCAAVALPFAFLSMMGCQTSVPRAEAKPEPAPQAKAPAAAEAKTAAAPKAHSRRTTKPDFDFYVVSLSWSPQHCSTNGDRDKLQCAPGRLYDFVLHGLWPQNEKGWPENCNTGQVSRATVDSMLDIMPSPGLIRHEWSKHGTCSGLDSKEYFAEARQAFNSIKIPEKYKRPKLQVMARPDEMRKEFAKANPSFPEDGFAVVCSGRFLQEVRACVTPDLDPRPCNREVQRNQCRVDEMIMRPVR